MLMKFSMQNTDWFQAANRKLQTGLRLAVSEDTNRTDMCSLWHRTRVYECPWMLHHAPPTGRILDIGSNAQWYCGLMGMGVENLTLHYTHYDISSIGRMFPWEEDGKGGIRLEKFFHKYRDKLTIVLGYLDKLQFIQEATYDTIYCISVVEHLPPEELSGLLDGMWRLLKPGGRLALTCDWFINDRIGKGIPNLLTNHNLSPFLKNWGVAPEQPLSGIPWTNEFNVEDWQDGDSVLGDFHKIMGVYGFTVTKPLT